MDDLIVVIDNFKEFDYKYVNYEENKIAHNNTYLIFDTVIRKNPTEDGVNDNIIDALVLKEQYEPNKKIDAMRVAQIKDHKKLTEYVKKNDIHLCKLIVVKNEAIDEVGAYIQISLKNK